MTNGGSVTKVSLAIGDPSLNDVLSFRKRKVGLPPSSAALESRRQCSAPPHGAARARARVLAREPQVIRPTSAQLKAGSTADFLAARFSQSRPPGQGRCARRCAIGVPPALGCWPFTRASSYEEDA
jgi:hypothetical protein